MDRLWELFSTAGVAKTAVICGAFLILVFGFLVWAAISQETIKLGWPTEISAPESEQMKACRTIQSALHEEIQTLENDRTSTYKTIDNDQNTLNEETRLRLDAMERDKSLLSNYNERVVIGRINQLESDLDYRNKIIEWIRQTIVGRFEIVYSSCAVIINAGR
jgi:hypothetical protein